MGNETLPLLPDPTLAIFLLDESAKPRLLTSSPPRVAKVLDRSAIARKDVVV
jgi:hypothetical protein